MAICIVTDFKKFPLKLPIDQQNSTQLTEAIENYEAIYLSELFNSDDFVLYNALEVTLKTTLDGLLKEAFKRLIYFDYVQDTKTQLTQSGAVETKPDNAIPAFNPVFLAKIYNEGVDYWNGAIAFMDENSISNNKIVKSYANAFFI